MRPWSAKTMTMVRITQQQLHFFRVLRRNNLEEKVLVAFHGATVKAWHASSTATDRRALINTA